MKYKSKNGKWRLEYVCHPVYQTFQWELYRSNGKTPGFFNSGWDFFDTVPSCERFKVISKLKLKPLYLMVK